MSLNKKTAASLVASLGLLLLFALPANIAYAQNVVRVTGKVISKEKRKPQMGVNITDERTKRLLAQTDEDGRFAVSLRDNGTLRFTMVGAEPVVVKVK